MILYIHYLINDIFVSRQILTAGESRSSPSSTSPELTEVAMLLAAILGVTYISLRTNDVINSTIAGARASGCDRLCLNSRGSASWVVASWAIERTVELAFAVAMETATFPRSTRSPSRTCSSYRNPPTMTETSCVVRMAMHDLSGARRRARLDLLFPWRRIGKRLKSAWWQRRTGGTSHIRLEQSSTSELNPERHRGRSGQTASGWWQHSASDALTSDNTAEQLPALGNHHYWIDWQPMTTHRPSRAGNRQSALSNVEPSSSNSGSVQRYMSIDDNDDEDDGGDEATEKENREHGRQRRPLSQLLVNDGGFIRFRENGDPDGLPISVSSADEDDDLNRKSDSEYETQIDANSNSGDRKSGWRLFGRSPKIPMFAGRQSNSVHSVTGLHSHRTDISTSKSYPVTYESLQESVRQTRSGYQLSPSTPKKTRACVVGDDVILEFAIPSMDLGDSIDRALHHCGTNPDD